jgi:5-methyltetrahydrofolate--homocysteine methyltransferase
MSQESSLAEAVAQCQEDLVKQLVREKLEAGESANDIVAECNRGMVELGNRFAREECFIPDLMFGGMIMKTVMADLEPRLAEGRTARRVGTAVMGSVQHDVHDIGKDIVVMMLRGSGFEVFDLGVDVPPETFVEAVRRHRPAVVGMSVLLTTCFRSVAATMEAIRQAGLRDQISVMVGGAAASQMLADNAGCDFYGKTAVDGLKHACRVVGVE